MKTVNGTARGGLAEAGFMVDYRDGKISIGGWPVLSASSYPEGALPFSRFVREGGGFDFLSEGAGQETDVTRFQPRHFSTEKILIL